MDVRLMGWCEAESLLGGGIETFTPPELLSNSTSVPATRRVPADDVPQLCRNLWKSSTLC